MSAMRKEDIIHVLRTFIKQRPGLDFDDYGDRAVYNAELREIMRDKREAETLLRAVERRKSITADDIVAASKSAFAGRLTITEGPDRRVEIDYTTGQYWPTEYRRAVCAVLASVLWKYAIADGELGDMLRATIAKAKGESK